MRWRNTSGRDDRVLRRLFRAVVREVARTLSLAAERGVVDEMRWRSAKILRGCDVWVRGSGSKGNSGRAALNGAYLRLTLGRWDTRSILWILQHEVWHLFGVRHVNMPAPVRYVTAGGLRGVEDRYAKLLAAIGPEVPPRREPKRKPKASRLERIVDAEKRWTTKLRRAQTALAKLRRQRRYHERRAAVLIAATGSNGEGR